MKHMLFFQYRRVVLGIDSLLIAKRSWKVEHHNYKYVLRINSNMSYASRLSRQQMERGRNSGYNSQRQEGVEEKSIRFDWCGTDSSDSFGRGEQAVKQM